MLNLLLFKYLLSVAHLFHFAKLEITILFIADSYQQTQKSRESISAHKIVIILISINRQQTCSLHHER